MSIGSPPPALCRGARSIPPHLPCSGQVRSRDIRVDRSTLQSPVLRRGSTAFRTFVPGGIVLVLSIETEPVLPTLSTFALTVTPIDCVPPSIYQSAIAKALFVSDSGVHSRSLVGLSAERSGTAYATTTYDILRHSGSRLPYRAQAHTSQILAASTARYPSHSLERTAIHFLPRRVRSRGRAHRRGVWAIFPA